MDLQTIYQQTIKYAATKHQEVKQHLPGTKLPYVIHLSDVAMEILIASQHTENFNTKLAVQAALLHDVVEDTNTTLEELRIIYGEDVTNGVLALTKNMLLPTKEEQMSDSLNRIKNQPHEVWVVKLADRITNLQKPPSHWDTQKMINYRAEALTILDALGAGNEYLAARLEAKIEEYKNYFES